MTTVTDERRPELTWGLPVHWVVAYDVADDRRRRAVARILGGCGRRVQESVFECRLTPGEWRWVRRRVGRVVERESDSVRWYPACLGCRGRLAHLDVSPGVGQGGHVIV
jgi:CRISPR-associated protein Cas2